MNPIASLHPRPLSLPACSRRPNRWPARSCPRNALAGGLALLLLSAGLAPLAAAGDADPLALKAKWTVGERRVHRLSLLQKQTIPMPGAPAPVEQTTTQEQEFAVRAAQAREGGGHELDMEFVRVQIDSRMGDQSLVKFDSKSAPADDGGSPFAAPLRTLATAKLKVFTRSDGQIEKVEGLDSLMAKINADLPSMGAEMVRGMVGEDMVKQLGVVPFGLPDQPVKVGDTWPVNMELKAGPMGTLVVALTMTFRSWETHQGYRCVTLDHKGRIWTKPGSVAASSPVGSASITGESKGTMWFDPQAGAVRQSVAQQSMQIKLKPMGTEMVIQSRQSVTNLITELKLP